MKTKKNKPSMKRFGVAPRVGYNSDDFYKRKLYLEGNGKNETEYGESPVPSEVVDSIICQDSRTMDQLPDRSIHLMITSPPYNVGKEYDENLALDEYRKLLRNVFQETYRVLVPGGRACINVANLGR